MSTRAESQSSGLPNSTEDRQPQSAGWLRQGECVASRPDASELGETAQVASDGQNSAFSAVSPLQLWP